jgi:hypothetical protein
MLTIPPANTAGAGAMGIFGYDIDGAQCWGHGGFWGTSALHCPTIDLTIALSINDALQRDVANRSLLPALFTLLQSTGSASATPPTASSQAATPPPGLIAPDPAECRVEPRPISFFEQLVASPPAALTPPANPADLRFSPPGDEPLPWTMPAGTPADPAIVEAATATLLEAEACLNANDTLRFLALFTDEMIRIFFAMNPLPPEALPSLAATPQPSPSDQWLGYFNILDARMLPDGRVAILADTWDPTQPPYGRGTDFAILTQVGDRWLIDSLIENVVIVGESTPTAGLPLT